MAGLKEASASAKEDSNVLKFNGATTLDIDPDKILEELYGELSDVVIAGYDKKGEYVFVSSIADGGNVLWLIEKLKKRLLSEELEE